MIIITNEIVLDITYNSTAPILYIPFIDLVWILQLEAILNCKMTAQPKKSNTQFMTYQPFILFNYTGLKSMHQVKIMHNLKMR